MSVNYVELQDKLKQDPKLIEEVIGKLGYLNIQDKGKYYSAMNSDGNNSGALCVWKESLRYTNYTRNHEGNIITLTMTDRRCNFPKALEYIADWIGFKPSGIIVERPFHGFYKKIIAERLDSIPFLEEYSWDKLPDPNCFSKKYIDDGVDIITQRDWGIRYSIDDNAILTPIVDLNNKLIGCKARTNSDEDMSHRFYAYLPYQKNAVVYGANQNYQKIITKNTVIITEAEKSVLQANAFGLNCVVALGGHSISNIQANIIKSLMCKNVIVAFDRGICEEEIRYEAKKLKTENALINNNVFYLYDKEDRFLKDKESPTDNGKKCLLGMLKECKYKL